jgi:GTP cyclohydrolase I
MVDRKRAAAAIEDFLRALGHDPAREPSLEGTGARVTDLYADELLDGYRADLDAIFREATPTPAPADASVVAVQRIATHVVCPHHLTIAAGHAGVAYLPGERVVGLGSIVQLVDACAHRLALQEEVGASIVRALVDRLGARGAACILTLRHGCLEHHGEKKRGARVRTIALAGVFAEREGDRATAMRALFEERVPRRRREPPLDRTAPPSKRAKRPGDRTRR